MSSRNETRQYTQIINYIEDQIGADIDRDMLRAAITATDVAIDTDLGEALVSVGNDEIRVFAPSALDTDIGEALSSVGNDILRVDAPNTLPTEQQTPVGVEDSTGTQINPLDDGVKRSVGSDEVRVSSQAGIEENLKDDNQFTATFRATGVADGNVAIDAVISNPSGSGVNGYVTPTFVTGGLAYLDFETNITIDSAGTTLAEAPKDIQSGSTTALTVEQGGSYTTNGSSLPTLLPGSSNSGGPATNNGASTPSADAVVLEPGDSIRYIVTNQSGGSADFSVEFDIVQE